MGASPARERWDPLSTTALVLVALLVILTALRAYTLWQVVDLGHREWFELVVLMSLAICVIVLFISGRRWRQVQTKIADDITARLQAETALRESEERFHQLAENLPGVVYLFDARRQAMLFVSSAYDSLFGLTRASLYANPRAWLEAVHPDDRERVEHAFDSRRQTRLDIVYRLQRPDGEVRWIEDCRFPIRHAEGPTHLVGGVVFDISDRRKLEDQLVQAQRMESLGRLAGGVAHDFNNLLTVILSYADFLKEEVSGHDGWVAGLTEIENAGRRASSLTRQLLTFARRQAIVPRLLDLNEVVEGMTTRLANLTGDQITIAVKAGAADPFIRADPSQVEHVIVNLSVNARDAMPRGGTLRLETGNVHLTADRTPQELSPGDYVTMTVSDTGAGIPLDLQGKVFEPFFTTKSRTLGAGLGLSTIYGIVAQCGGHVSMTSMIGEGSVFTCYFPVQIKTEPATISGSIRAQRQETVLVIEDEAMVREVARHTLARHGYQVLTAADGAEGLRIASSNAGPIDLVVTDVRMPLMGGHELAMALKHIRPTLKVLFVSGYNEELVAPGGGVDDGVEFLAKPYLPAVLSQRVRELLDGAGGS